MGCAPSKLEEKKQEVVTICRDRKNKLKVVVRRRHELAEAHCRYCQSLYAMAAAIKLFVSHHSSPNYSYLTTYNKCLSQSPTLNDQNVITNPMFHEEKANREAVGSGNSGASTCSSGSSEELITEEEAREHKEKGSEYYYEQMQAPMMPPPLPRRDSAWDYFNPFEINTRPESFSSYWRSSDDDLRMIREKEGIPELEEIKEGKKVMAAEEKGKVELEDARTEGVEEKVKVHNAIDSTTKGIELLEALKDIQDNFIKAFDSGKELSRMLETSSSFCLPSGLDNLKENSSKFITWHRTISCKPSPCKSLVSSSSKKSSTWTEFKNDLFADHGIMNSGSHSLTLGRLYAWEKKLYEEVKAGDNIRRIYEKKCSRLRSRDVKKDEELSANKTKAAVKDLYARILVGVRRAESISKRIEKLRDEELQPQIVELLRGLSQTWKKMLESHELQSKILLEVDSFGCPAFGRFSNYSHQLATLQLETEIQSWRQCFVEYVAAQRQYVEALHRWLTKFLVPDVEFYSIVRSSTTSFQASGPALLMICHKWSSVMKRLPEETVSTALKSFSRDIRALCAQQGEEEQQKRKVDSLAEEVDHRALAFKKTEMGYIDSKLIGYSTTKLEADQQADHLTDKKTDLNMLRMKLEIEKEKHQNFMQETQRIAMNRFQTGLATIFKSLTEFSKGSMKMYNDLATYSESVGKAENQSYIENSKIDKRKAQTGFSL